MSTRAIIGYLRENGNFIGGWQWNDGRGLAPLLRRHFNTAEKVDCLIRNGVWNNISSPRDKEMLEMFAEFSNRPNSDYHTVEAGKCQLLKHRPCDNAEFCFGGDKGISIENGAIVFDSLETAMDQDASYVYEFNTKDGTWKTHGYNRLVEKR